MSRGGAESFGISLRVAWCSSWEVQGLFDSGLTVRCLRGKGSRFEVSNSEESGCWGV